MEGVADAASMVGPAAAGGVRTVSAVGAGAAAGAGRRAGEAGAAGTAASGPAAAVGAEAAAGSGRRGGEAGAAGTAGSNPAAGAEAAAGAGTRAGEAGAAGAAASGPAAAPDSGEARAPTPDAAGAGDSADAGDAPRTSGVDDAGTSETMRPGFPAGSPVATIIARSGIHPRTAVLPMPGNGSGPSDSHTTRGRTPEAGSASCRCRALPPVRLRPDCGASFPALAAASLAAWAALASACDGCCTAPATFAAGSLLPAAFSLRLFSSRSGSGWTWTAGRSSCPSACSAVAVESWAPFWCALNRVISASQTARATARGTSSSSGDRRWICTSVLLAERSVSIPTGRSTAPRRLSATISAKVGLNENQRFRPLMIRIEE